MEIPLTVADELHRRVRLGLATAGPVVVGPGPAALDREMRALGSALATEHAGRTPGSIEGLAPARELYRSFGVDPTRTRPSSEALLRRVLRRRPLPRVLNAVDVCNLCSLRFLLPIGLYDADRLRGEVVLRRGGAGESYAGIRKDEVHLEGRPVLVDAEGPFGNPTSDSLRTSVGGETTNLWMVIFGPASVPAARMEENVRFACAAMERHLSPDGGRIRTTGSIWLDGASRPVEGVTR